MRNPVRPITVLAALLITLGCSDDGPSGPVSSELPTGDVATFASQMNAHRESVGCTRVCHEP